MASKLIAPYRSVMQFWNAIDFRRAAYEVVAAAVPHHFIDLPWGQYGQRCSAGDAASTLPRLGHRTEASCSSPVSIVWDCRLAFVPCFVQADPGCYGLLAHDSCTTGSQTRRGSRNIPMRPSHQVHICYVTVHYWRFKQQFFLQKLKRTGAAFN